MQRTPWLLPLATAVGAIGLLLGWRSRWLPTVCWIAVGLLGYAASLQLIDAGPFVRYQHYLPPTDWVRMAPVPALILLAQAILVAAAAWRERRELATLIGGWPRATVILAFVTFGITAATLSANPLRWGAELAIASAVQVLHLVTALLAAGSMPADQAERIEQWTRRFLSPGAAPSAGRAPAIPDRALLALALFAGLVPAVLAVVVYQRHPHVPDELVYLLHARYFAAGRLFLPIPEPFGGFDVDLMFADRGRWFSPVPPGWPAMLAIGIKLGVPWLVNPLLNAVNVFLAHALIREVYDRRTARLAAAIYALSPWNLFLAMSILTHTFTITAGLGAAIAVVRYRRGQGVGLMVGGGVAIGVVSLIRPLEGLALAILLGLWTLGVRPWRRLIAGATALVTATAATAAVTLPYNRVLTGNSGRFPIMAYTDALYSPGANALGFGANRGLGWSGLDPLPGHGPADVVINSLLNLFAINIELLGWACGSLLLIALFVFRGRFNSGDRSMLATIAVVVGLHALYWFGGGPDFGARYWFLASIPLIALTARAILTLPSFHVGGLSAARATVGVVALTLSSLVVFVPWRAGDKYFRYRGMRPDLRGLVATNRFGADLVLIRGRRHPDYASAAAFNSLEPQPTRPIFAWDRDSTTRRALIERFRGRQVWLVDGPTITGTGYRIIAGPLDPAQLGQSGR